MILRYNLVSRQYVMQCDICRKEFRTRRAHAKTCSSKCRQKLHRRVTFPRGVEV